MAVEFLGAAFFAVSSSVSAAASTPGDRLGPPDRLERSLRPDEGRVPWDISTASQCPARPALNVGGWLRKLNPNH
jgi:hypothetical protein